MNMTAKILKKGILIPGVNDNNAKIQFKIFESDIEPILRFMHIQKIKSNGLVTIDKNKCTMCYNNNVDISIETNWKNIISVEDDTSVCPLKIMSFDIECNCSSME